MTIPIVWLSFDEKVPARGYWDQGIIEGLFSGELWRPTLGLTFSHFTKEESLKELAEFEDCHGAIIVFPARAQAEHIDKLNDYIAKFEWVVVMLTGDEESVFPYEKIKHEKLRIWVMSPRPERHKNVTYIGTGFPAHARELIKQCEQEYLDKPLDFYFAGQITHQRREEMAEQLKHMSARPDMTGEYLATDGFTKGLPPAAYYKMLSAAKTAPCPSGPETPDSFRLFEALECGTIPIADTRSPKGDFPDNYWEVFFGEPVPFPVLTLFDQLPGYTLAAMENWPALSNKIFSWWLAQKRKLAYTLQDQIVELNGKVGDVADGPTDLRSITVLIPTSPIESHPSTETIERTIADVRSQLPNSEVIIMFDGVRKQQEHYRARYEEYKRRTIWKCHHQWHNVLPLVFEPSELHKDGHYHQAAMTVEALKLVTTPTILFVEHDAPITPDQDFEWSKLIHAITTGRANIIRFHHEAHILPDHEHLMLGEVEWQNELPMRKTMQWSQRPHLASTEFYRTMLANYFNPESKTMIEDVMHGVVYEQVRHGGIMAWYNWRLWIYHPEGSHIKRSYHIDARGSDPKFEMEILPVKK